MKGLKAGIPDVERGPTNEEEALSFPQSCQVECGCGNQQWRDRKKKQPGRKVGQVLKMEDSCHSGGGLGEAQRWAEGSDRREICHAPGGSQRQRELRGRHRH